MNGNNFERGILARIIIMQNIVLCYVQCTNQRWNTFNIGSGNGCTQFALYDRFAALPQFYSVFNLIWLLDECKNETNNDNNLNEM